MPTLEYSRVDFNIDITVDDKRAGTVVWSTSDGWVSGRQLVPAGVIAAWIGGADPTVNLPSMVAALTEWTAQLPSRPPETLYRVALDIADTEVGGAAWEEWLNARIVPLPAAVVRTTQVRLRGFAVAVTLPLRVVELDTPPVTNLLNLFGVRPPDEIALAFQVERMTAPAFPPASWPAVDILYCSPFTMTPPLGDMMSESTPDTPGTLGWFLRQSERQQTRLIVLRASTPDQARRARALATALVRRGGPAVLVADYAPGFAESALEQFNRNLLHDFPLDFAFHEPLPRGVILVPPPVPALFVGGGREDALRISAVAQMLLEIKAQLSPALDEAIGEPVEPDIVYEAEHDAVNIYLRQLMKSRGRPSAASTDLVGTLTQFESQWQQIRFNLHEDEGTLPVARTLGTLRIATGAAGGPVTWQQMVHVEVPAIPSRSIGRSIRILKQSARLFHAQPITVHRPRARAVPSVPAERFLNATLWWQNERSRLSRLAPEGCLERGRVYQVGAQIGPRDSAILTVDAAAIVEEVFKFTPDSTGVWIQIGITGLDFEVLGHPVQEVWLPRHGASEMVYFPIRTDRVGPARLRLVLYFKNFVVQSLRVGAIVMAAGDPAPSARVRGERLAAALGSDKLGAATSAGHAARLEYNLAVPVTELENSAERALTIVANDLDGQSVVTVHGSSVEHKTRTNNELVNAVKLARDALHDVSFLPIAGSQPEKYLYQFGYSSERNAGTPEMLKKSLRTLADKGWNLFTSTFPETSLPELMKLSAADQIFHVAHVLLEKSIPWGAMYDRPFDPNRCTDENGGPVLQDACLAALKADGTFSTRQCGTHADCLLNPAKVAAARAAQQKVAREDSIACPLHFWGFRHVIEAPAQQPEDNRNPNSLVTAIHAGAQAQLVAGFNPDLPDAGKHQAELDEVVKGVSAAWAKKATKRDELIDSMKTLDLHLVYLYCHARDGDETKAPRPYLEFTGAGTTGRIFAADLRGWPCPWKHSPLVMLNGCGTAGFSPNSLSPFVTTLVQDRGAAGVLGTEIPVAEMLAREAALSFLTPFLAGSPAGMAMLAMRRALLAKANPLGLVYVLYSSADLKVIYAR